MQVKELLNLSEEVGNYYSVNLEDKLKTQLKVLMDNLEKYFENKCIEENKVLRNRSRKRIQAFFFIRKNPYIF